MMYALTASSERIEPTTSGEKAFCPACAGVVVAKCGDFVVWHWAHMSGADCSEDHEGETDWHRRWKMLAPTSCREVYRGGRRADVLVDGTAIEFQHSHIKLETVEKREAHWGDLVWVVDGVLAYERNQGNPYDTVGLLIEERVGGGLSTLCKMVWFNGKKWPRECNKKVFIDLGGEGVDGLLFEVVKWWPTKSVIADGRLVSHRSFADRYLTPYIPKALPPPPKETDGLPLFGSAS